MGILKPLCWTDWFSFTVSFCFMYFEDLLLTVYIFTIAISSWSIDPFYHYEWPNLFLVIFLKFILFEITIVTPVHAYCLIGSTEWRHFQKSKKRWFSIVPFLLTLEILVIPLFCRSGKKMFTSLPREIKWQLPLRLCSKSYKQVLENRLCDEKFRQTHMHGCTYTHPYPEIINSGPFTHKEKTETDHQGPIHGALAESRQDFIAQFLFQCPFHSITLISYSFKSSVWVTTAAWCNNLFY